MVAASAVRHRVRGITIPLGPLGISIGVHRRGAIAIAIGLRAFLK
jgi:hypothetical protein